MIHIGFTGSQYGMSLPTKQTLMQVARGFYEAGQFSSSVMHFHHGDCKGSDETASAIFKSLGFVVHGHPCFIEKKRAFSEHNDIIHAPKDPLERNHELAELSRTLIATPHTKNEIIRSGTWATIRYARKLNRELCIIFPDGSESWENSARADRREAD